jgi:MFS transporter, AAHS family, benzoate transport protein
VATWAFAVGFAANLLTNFGLTTWLPDLMRRSGFSWGTSLSFLLVMALGALIGLPLVGRIADRVGFKITTVSVCLACALAIAGLSLRPSLPITYLVVAATGVGTIGLQVTLNGWVVSHFSVGNRGTALGWALGVGRLGAIIGPTVAGLLAAAGAPPRWDFYVFASASVLAAVALLLIPDPHAAAFEQHTTRPEQRAQ